MKPIRSLPAFIADIHTCMYSRRACPSSYQVNLVPRSSFPLFWVAAAPLLFALGCAQPEPPAPPPPEVVVDTVTRQDLPLSLDYPGRVAGSRVVDVRARVSGVVVERAYREGQPVKAGDLLFRIEPDTYRATAEQAAAQVQMQRAAIAQSTSDYERAKALVAEGAVSRREFDQAEAAYLRPRRGWPRRKPRRRSPS